ncbi:LOW QUALITY PROTEIN: disintegrin and metalloproteinase domain-containing protein 20 [Ctenodactylus gundi]
MAVEETLLCIRVTLLQLCLGVFLFIPGLSQAMHSQHFTSAEVVIPLRVTSRSRGAKLQFGGQRHVVHIKVKKHLFSMHLPVLTYTAHGALHQDQPFVKNDCYYHGYVEGVSESLVALSICVGGFRGMLQINELAYEIEPVRPSATFEHLVYKIANDEIQFPLKMTCGLTEEEIAHQLKSQLSHNFTLTQSSYAGWWAHSYLELVVVVDHVRYLFSGSNVSVVQPAVFNVVNIVDSLYDPLKIDVTLTGIVIWNGGNPFSTSGDLGQVVEQFAFWKFTHLDAQFPHDVAHLLVKELHGRKLGVGYVNGVSQQFINCGVDVFEGKDLVLFAIMLSHELDHNLGMLHDTEMCVCGFRWCIMYPSRKMTYKFNSCSYAQYYDNAMLPTALCIHPPPNPMNIFRLKHCGNLVVEEGEECDCGTFGQCAKDPWCRLNCPLHPGAACAFGISCKDCNFLPSGTLCRQEVSEFDLPEWCNGTYYRCPDDVYVQDGIPCSGNAYCYSKACNNRDMQCREIFGTHARSTSQSCYNEINTQGNRFGHCDIVGTEYVKCLSSDVMCGRVQCENVSKIPCLSDHSTVHQFHNNTTCWGTDYHLGMSIPDIGQVKSRTVCGPGKMCIRKKCADLIDLPRSCTSDMCNMRGICNNKQHCHCDRRWAPPYCVD